MRGGAKLLWHLRMKCRFGPVSSSLYLGLKRSESMYHTIRVLNYHDLVLIIDLILIM